MRTSCAPPLTMTSLPQSSPVWMPLALSVMTPSVPIPALAVRSPSTFSVTSPLPILPRTVRSPALVKRKAALE